MSIVFDSVAALKSHQSGARAFSGQALMQKPQHHTKIRHACKFPFETLFEPSSRSDSCRGRFGGRVSGRVLLGVQGQRSVLLCFASACKEDGRQPVCGPAVGAIAGV